MNQMRFVGRSSTALSLPREARVRPAWAAPRQRLVRLWLPLTAFFLLLAPFGLILAPLLCLHPMLRGASPWAIASRLGALLLSLGGTRVEVNSPAVLVRIRIF